MKLYGLIGRRLSHSFSKGYFSKKFQQESLKECQYENFELDQIEKIKALVQSSPNLCGVNVTIPYKEQVVPLLDQANEIVRAVGACNCIKVEQGKLLGYNTDVVGFKQSLLKNLQRHHENALILGTGGAAKAVAYALQELGLSYSFVSREKKDGLFSYSDLTEDHVKQHLLVINTTPLGMYPEIEGLPQFPYEALSSHHLLFDLIYNPEKTLFLQKGEERGAIIQNGYEMLILQAEESWRIWNTNS